MPLSAHRDAVWGMQPINSKEGPRKGAGKLPGSRWAPPLPPPFRGEGGASNPNPLGAHACPWVLAWQSGDEGGVPTQGGHGARCEGDGTNPNPKTPQTTCKGPSGSGGVFAQRAHSARTAPIITVLIQVTALKTTHLRNHAQSIQNSKIQTSDACHGSQGPKFCPL